MKIGDNTIPQVTQFRYLGPIVQSDGEIERDVNFRIQAEWMKWRSTSRVICDKKVPLKLRGKIYYKAVRLPILYGLNMGYKKTNKKISLMLQR